MAVISRGGKTFDNGDVQIAMLGSIDYEVTKISYSTEQDHTANYALGSCTALARLTQERNLSSVT